MLARHNERAHSYRLLAVRLLYTAAATLLFVAASAAHARAGAIDAQSLFEERFGQEARQATASADKNDDVKFAGRLLAAADELKDLPELKVLLYQKAYEFALRAPTGYATAEKALAGLDAASGDHKADTEERHLELLQILYRNASLADKPKAADMLIARLLADGDACARAEKYSDAMAYYRRAQTMANAVQSERKDEVQTRLRENAPRATLEPQIAPLKARLKAAATDTAAAESLIHIYMVDLDNPAGAAEYASYVTDEKTKNCLLLAALPPANLPERACLALGDWYVTLANPPASPARIPMLRRARIFYEQYMTLHADEDADRARAAAALQKMARELDGPGAWVDVLKLVEPAKDAVAGTWKVDAGLLGSDDSAPAMLRLPYQPPEEYDVQIIFARTSGAGDVGLILQKAGAQFEWIMDVGGKYCGFETVDGQRAGSAKNPSSFTAILRNNQRYTVLIQVRNTGLKAYIEGQPVSTLKTNYKNLGTYSEFGIPGTRCLGLLTWNSTVAFQTIRVLEVTGKGKTGRDPPAGTDPAAGDGPPVKPPLAPKTAKETP
jgi:hypothetical protein